jgi:adenosylcobinamide-GDP ribazoletransferase
MELSLSQKIVRMSTHLVTAIRFMTILPLRWKAHEDGDNFPASVIYFPVVGVLIGGLGFLLTTWSSHHFPASVTSFLLVCFLACITGGLHLDGLADSGDGLLCSLPREKRLTIMKDSRMGAMGGIALIIVLLGKYSCLANLPGTILAHAAMLMPIGGRCAILLVMGTVGYGRHEGGLGGLFYRRQRFILSIWGVVFLASFAFLLQPQYFVVLTLLVVSTSLLFARWCKNVLGGATGDTLGAVCELSELTVALALNFY